MWSKSENAPIWRFLLLVFLITYVSYGLCIIGEHIGLLAGDTGSLILTLIDTFIVACAPMYALLILLVKYKQVSSIKEFLQRIFHVENIIPSILITGFFCVGMMVVAILCGVRTDYPIYLFLPAIPLMILGGGLEEIGWRGFLQPALERKLPFPVATIIVCAVWTLWPSVSR